MAYTAQPSTDFAQRLAIIRRHLTGLTVALDALEREIQSRQEQQSDGERAAQRAREVVYRQGPSEVKVIHD